MRWKLQLPKDFGFKAPVPKVSDARNLDKCFSDGTRSSASKCMKYIANSCPYRLTIDTWPYPSRRLTSNWWGELAPVLYAPRRIWTARRHQNYRSRKRKSPSGRARPSHPQRFGVRSSQARQDRKDNSWQGPPGISKFGFEAISKVCSPMYHTSLTRQLRRSRPRTVTCLD